MIPKWSWEQLPPIAKRGLIRTGMTEETYTALHKEWREQNTQAEAEPIDEMAPPWERPPEMPPLYYQRAFPDVDLSTPESLRAANVVLAQMAVHLVLTRYLTWGAQAVTDAQLKNALNLAYPKDAAAPSSGPIIVQVEGLKRELI